VEHTKLGRNPKGSTGPRTAEGKARASMNAMTHSLTARIVLPWESEEEYDARVLRFRTGLPVKSELDLEIAERAAQFSWLMDRALVADRERIIQESQDSREAVAAREEDEAELLINRLLFDRRGPTELYPGEPCSAGEARTSWSGNPNDPDSPRAIVK